MLTLFQAMTVFDNDCENIAAGTQYERRFQVICRPFYFSRRFGVVTGRLITGKNIPCLYMHLTLGISEAAHAPETTNVNALT